jgi:Transposase, Mutator family
MALVELLEKADDGDFLRAVAEAVLQLLMEADVESVIGAGRHERSPERLNYRNGHRPRSSTHPAWLAPATHPEAAPGLVLPALPRAAQDQRESTGRRHPRGLDRRRLDPPRRRSRAGHGPHRHLQEPGLQALQGHRRAGRRLSRPSARRRLVLSLARRHLSPATRGRPHRDRRGGGRRRRAARDRRPARRPVAMRGCGVPAPHIEPRPSGRPSSNGSSSGG